jgi:hypothetical protein
VYGIPGLGSAPPQLAFSGSVQSFLVSVPGGHRRTTAARLRYRRDVVVTPPSVTPAGLVTGLLYTPLCATDRPAGSEPRPEPLGASWGNAEGLVRGSEANREHPVIASYKRSQRTTVGNPWWRLRRVAL